MNKTETSKVPKLRHDLWIVSHATSYSGGHRANHLRAIRVLKLLSAIGVLGLLAPCAANAEPIFLSCHITFDKFIPDRATQTMDRTFKIDVAKKEVIDLIPAEVKYWGDNFCSQGYICRLSDHTFRVEKTSQIGRMTDEFSITIDRHTGRYAMIHLVTKDINTKPVESATASGSCVKIADPLGDVRANRF
jgi:hypothetical protein